MLLFSRILGSPQIHGKQDPSWLLWVSWSQSWKPDDQSSCYKLTHGATSWISWTILMSKTRICTRAKKGSHGQDLRTCSPRSLPSVRTEYLRLSYSVFCCYEWIWETGQYTNQMATVMESRRFKANRQCWWVMSLQVGNLQTHKAAQVIMWKGYRDWSQTGFCDRDSLEITQQFLIQWKN